ncbi:MAG TPA: hypothetical protein VHD56_02345 [Tepidisphaeraceae bacterium]|nr:hypothetical protein [Tepidisphaeraceae bacterium]
MSEYQTITPGDNRVLTDFLVRNGQFLLPMVRLIEEARLAIDEVIDVTGRTCIQAILEASARELAGKKSPGRRSGDIRWHGHQEGIVHLAERKLRVSKPRLRHKSGAEVEVPAYRIVRKTVQNAA